MSFIPIHQIASTCQQKNISDVVLCPGSRCAPLTLAFARQPGMNVRTFSDERSAAFIALGIARQTKRPVALVCTSGTAAYNFAPAIAEAFFSGNPLLVFTADRPREWIAQHDGQTIFQPGIFGKHVKMSYDLPQEYAHPDDRWAINRMINEAINVSMAAPVGPVHINVPLREPLYPTSQDKEVVPSPRIIESLDGAPELTDAEQAKVVQEFEGFHNILIVAGQHDYDGELLRLVDTLSVSMHIPVVAEVTGNFHSAENTIRHVDACLGAAADPLKESLRPDLLITFGRGVVSKHLKTFLRRFPAKAHWHIQGAGPVADTFQQLTRVIRTTPVRFVELLLSVNEGKTSGDAKQQKYFNRWKAEELRALKGIEEWFAQSEGVSELSLVHDVIRSLPPGANLHLANSLSVRYAAFSPVPRDRPDVIVYANRGTSGIDGCSSVTVGHALAGKQMNVLITGDVAFFYDRNAFWHNYDLPNLRVVVLNNHGGAIFKVVEGAEDLPESEELFVTQQKLDARKLCEEFGFGYIRLDTTGDVEGALRDFFNDDGVAKILELETSAREAKASLEQLRQHLNKQ